MALLFSSGISTPYTQTNAPGFITATLYAEKSATLKSSDKPIATIMRLAYNGFLNH